MIIVFIFLMSFFTLYSAQLPDLETGKEEGLSFTVAGGRLWRNLTSREVATLESDMSVRQHSDFVITSLKGYVLEMETKFKFNRYFSPLVAYVYGSTKNGYGYIDIYNIKNSRRIETIDFQNIRPIITEEFLTLANESLLFEKDYGPQKVSGDFFIGYFLEKDKVTVYSLQDNVTDFITWYGFRTGIKLNFEINSKFTVSFLDLIRIGKLSSSSSDDSFLEGFPGIERLYYFSNLFSCIFDYTLSKDCSLGLFLEWDNLKDVGTPQLILDRKAAKGLINAKILSLKETIFSISIGLGFSF